MFDHDEIRFRKVGKQYRGRFNMWKPEQPDFRMECTVWGKTAEEVQEKIKQFLNGVEDRK